MEQTYQELLKSVSDYKCQNSAFIEINKRLMAQVDLNEQDYDFFWGCMKLYEKLGVNYYESYLKARTGEHGDLSGGVEQWLKSYGLSMSIWESHNVNYYDTYSTQLDELIKTLSFFEINDYCGKSLLELNALQKETKIDWERAYGETTQLYAKNCLRSKESKANNYFNFGDFSETQFNAYVELFTTKCKSGNTMSIDEALRLAQNAPNRMYIVLFSCNGQVCYIGKTTQPLSYIGSRHKKIGADSAVFEAVPEDYADDVLLSTMIFYDLKLENARTTRANRKYATIQQACFAYKLLESFSRKKVLSAIRDHRLRVVDLYNGQALIDKIELERAIRK